MTNPEDMAFPPSIGNAEFEAVTSYDGDVISEMISLFVKRLHAYLESLDCLKGIHYLHHYRISDDDKKTGKDFLIDCFSTEYSRQDKPDLGGAVSTYYGDFDEAHIGISLFPSHFRIGLGFKLVGCYFQDACAARERFTNVLKDDSDEIQQLVRCNHFEIEAYGGRGHVGFMFIPPERAVDWLVAERNERFMWLYLGRILMRGRDRAVLENPVAFGGAIESALVALRVLWDKL